MTPRFAIFYPDRTLVDNGEDVVVTYTVPRVWFESQTYGVQAVIRHREDGVLVPLYGDSYYMVMQNGEPMQTNNPIVQFQDAGIAKTGLQIPDESWNRVFERMRAYRKQHRVTP